MDTPQIDEATARAAVEDAAREEPDIPAVLDTDRGEDEFAVGMGTPEEWEETGELDEYEQGRDIDADEEEEATLGDGSTAHIPRPPEGAPAEAWQLDATLRALGDRAAPLDEVQASAGLGMGDLQRALGALREQGKASEVAPGEWARSEEERAERIEERVEEIEEDIAGDEDVSTDTSTDESIRAESPPAKPILGVTPARALVALDITLSAPDGDQDTLDAVERLAEAAVEGIRMEDGVATFKILSVEKYEATRKLV